MNDVMTAIEAIFVILDPLDYDQSRSVLEIVGQINETRFAWQRNATAPQPTPQEPKP